MADQIIIDRMKINERDCDKNCIDELDFCSSGTIAIEPDIKNYKISGIGIEAGTAFIQGDFELHIPNAETIEAINDVLNENNLTSFDSVEDLFDDLER